MLLLFKNELRHAFLNFIINPIALFCFFVGNEWVKIAVVAWITFSGFFLVITQMTEALDLLIYQVLVSFYRLGIVLGAVSFFVSTLIIGLTLANTATFWIVIVLVILWILAAISVASHFMWDDVF